jgi:hypothetical protein
MSSLSKFDLVNRALIRIGANTITDFEGNSVESETAAKEYDGRIDERLSGIMLGYPPPGGHAHEWRFAMKIAALGTPTATAPADKWDYAYNLPSDLLAIRAVRRDDLPVEYDRVGHQLLSDDEADIVLEYTFRQTEANFPAYFTAALVEDLAAFFAFAVKRDSSLAKTHLEAAVGLWAAARHADSKARTPQVFKASRLVAARLGSR